MKYLPVLIILILLSCKNDKSINEKPTNILGNWSSYYNNEYKEFYISEKKIYLYNTGMGNFYEYNYIIKQDSLYVSNVLKDKEKQMLKFENKILKQNSSQIIFEVGTFEKINDTVNLEMYIKKHINYDKYNSQAVYRQRLIEPLDSLIKLSGDPIDLNKIN